MNYLPRLLLGFSLLCWLLSYVPMGHQLNAWSLGLAHWWLFMSVLTFQIRYFEERQSGELAAAAILAIFAMILLPRLFSNPFFEPHALSVQMKLFVVLPFLLLILDILFFGIRKLYLLATHARH